MQQICLDPRSGFEPLQASFEDWPPSPLDESINMNMKQQSTVFGYLTSEIISNLNQELLNNKNNPLWGGHVPENSLKYKQYSNNGPLRHGKTVWLEHMWTSLVWNFGDIKNFPETNKIIHELAGTCDYGRCYWHTLPPGAEIDKHQDTADIPSYFDFVKARYQIYLDIPEEAIIIIDDKIWGAKTLKNCILDFNMTLPHYYKNNSNRDFTFAVIDILNPDCKVINRPN
jgi:hypothetical protein